MVHYTINSLIGLSPILIHRSFEHKIIPDIYAYGVLSSVSRMYPPDKVRLAEHYGAVRRGLTPHDSHGLGEPG